MNMGKWIGGIAAFLGILLLIGCLAWYLTIGAGDRGFEKEGTLVEEEAACPAFVTDPETMVWGEDQLQRSGRGL